jgi:hypothetical protein
MRTDFPHRDSIRCDSCLAVIETPAPRMAGRDWCTRCATRKACAQAGHEFGAWELVTEDPESLVQRVCLGCGTDELAPAWAAPDPESVRGLAYGHRWNDHGTQAGVA